MIRRSLPLVFAASVLLSGLASPPLAGAQPLGTFRWQLQPYCTVLTVSVVQQGGHYLLDGTADECGAATRASVSGLAFLNPNGTIGFGLTLVRPNGRGLPLSATISLGTLGGQWEGLGGAVSGPFVFTPGANTGGQPLPSLSGGVLDVVAGPGLIGGGGTSQVQLDLDFAVAQRRVSGACPGGQAIASVSQNGTVTCQALTGSGGGDITAVIAGSGLSGGATTGDATLAVTFGGTGGAALAARSDHTHAGTGANTTAVGVNALPNNTAVQNTALGAHTLAANTGGGNNTAVGALALTANVTGNNNTAVGALTLRTATAGANNTAVGTSAMGSTTTGTSNAAVGVLALFGNTTGHENVAMGQATLGANTTGSRNTAVGHAALGGATTANGNAAMGWRALLANTTGDGNTAMGEFALRSNTTASSNTAIGRYAMELNVTGESNTAVGREALSFNDSGSENTAIGYGAMVASDTGSFNTAVGRGAMFNTHAGNNNTAVGWMAMQQTTTGSANTALGRHALNVNTTGSNNVAIGVGALDTATIAGFNTAVGPAALTEVTTGTDNIGIGFNAGLGLTTGSGNIYVGGLASSGSEASTIRIGSGQTAAYISGISGATASGGIPVLVNGAGRLGTTTSSARFKDAITPLGDTTRAKLLALTPVSFVYKPEFDDGSQLVQYGLIAEDVAERFPELLVRDADGQPQTVRYHLLPPLLLAEVQRLERDRVSLDARLSAQDAELARLRVAVEALSATLSGRQQ